MGVGWGGGSEREGGPPPTQPEGLISLVFHEYVVYLEGSSILRRTFSPPKGTPHPLYRPPYLKSGQWISLLAVIIIIL